MALIVVLALIPANAIIMMRPRLAGQKSKTRLRMDWTVFRDGPFLLLVAGKAIL